MEIVKTLISIKGKLLGEVFETVNGYGFFCHLTETEKDGFADVESAYDALLDVHYEFVGNQ